MEKCDIPVKQTYQSEDAVFTLKVHSHALGDEVARKHRQTNAKIHKHAVLYDDSISEKVTKEVIVFAAMALNKINNIIITTLNSAAARRTIRSRI